MISPSPLSLPFFWARPECDGDHTENVRFVLFRICFHPLIMVYYRHKGKQRVILRKERRNKMKNIEMNEMIDLTVARENGLETGTVFHLTREGRITVTLLENNLFDLEVNGELVETGKISTVTKSAKMIENPNFSDNTGFPASRAWVTFGGKRITEFMGSSAQRINGVSERVTSVNVVGGSCPSCFTEMPLTGLCDFC